MARFTTRNPFDMGAFLAEANILEFFNEATVTSSATVVSFRVADVDMVERLIVYGTFGNFVDGIPTSGTITRLRFISSDGENFNFNRISMSVADFNAYVQNNDTIGLFTDLLSDNDGVYGSTGNDVLQGFAGNDTINGRDGDDTMIGQLGNDRYSVNAIGDIVTELANEGNDSVTCYFDYTLPDNVEDLQLAGAANIGTGNGLDNLMIGENSANTLNGLAGNDTLRGLESRDILVGGDGDDVIDGGTGKDTMTGDAGADAFLFRDGDMQALKAGADLITDFSQTDGDEIKLNLVDADTTLDGNQKFSWLGDGAFTGVAGQLRYSQEGGLTYVEADTNGDMVADVFIALTGAIDLTSADFVL